MVFCVNTQYMTESSELINFQLSVVLSVPVLVMFVTYSIIRKKDAIFAVLIRILHNGDALLNNDQKFNKPQIDTVHRVQI